MTSSDSGYRFLGSGAAFVGLIVMMCAKQPSLASLSLGLAALAAFCASRAAPYLKRVTARAPSAVEVLQPLPAPSESVPPEGLVLPPDASLLDVQRALDDAGQAARRRRSNGEASSMLPPSRAARGLPPR